MFSQSHILWLLIGLLVIGGMLIINKIFKLTFKTNLNILLIVILSCEVVVILVNMTVHIPNDKGVLGTYLDPSYLPFHLCSVQIFFGVSLKFFIKKEETKQKLLCFMAPTMLLGGILAMCIPTEGTSFSNIQVYEYYCYHSYIVYFAIYLISNKIIDINLKVMFRNFAYLLILVVIGIWVNSILSTYAVNFFFLARPPMEGLPILNLNHGWHVYFISLFIVGIILIAVFHMPFIIAKRISLKKKSSIK